MPIFRLLLIAMLSTAWCLALLGLRFQWSGHTWFSFMAWNLFLAGIPLGFAVILTKTDRWRLATPLMAGWLLFFPNAPYVLTDLLHLKERGGMPLWFDLLMLLSFALVSLWFGFQSLHLVQMWIAEKTSTFTAWAFVGVSLLLSGFGIYLGRFLRWNSWDIIRRPGALLNDIWVRFADPLAHERTWGVTLGFGGLLLITYLFWMFSVSSSRDSRANVDRA
jgi:uncharacterized membrane protein